MRNLALGFSLIAATFTGCTTTGIGKDDYSCPGTPSGVLCKSPIEIYRLTNGADHINAKPADDAAPAKGKSSPPVATIRLQEPLTQPMPVLEPAQVLRIWIAPWIDATGDLHFPSFLFTEITPRQWTLGENAARSAHIVVPLQVDAQPPGRSSVWGEDEVSNSGAAPANAKSGERKPPAQAPLQPVLK